MKQRAILADLSMEKLVELTGALGQKPFRAKQLFHWVHQRNTCNPTEMDNLPKGFREDLQARFNPEPLSLKNSLPSADGAIKYGWLNPEDCPIEAVMMPGFGYGTAVCVSCQSGCPMACKFCETGYMGLNSWLSPGQILLQLYESEKLSGLVADRMVFMGMGEPLLNLRAVRHVVEILTSEDGRAWSPRRITVSTVGLSTPMVKLARTFPRVNLALSLHFTQDHQRKAHMPQADSDISKLAEALYFYRRTNGGKVTIEYTLINGVNDSDADAKRLASFANFNEMDLQSELVQEANETPFLPRLQPLPIHVNLIAFNPISSASYQASKEGRIDSFAQLLTTSNVPVTVRHSRGADVKAACGQLGAQLLSDKRKK